MTGGAAIVGVGSTPYFRRGESAPLTVIELAMQAILLALEDAGLAVDDLDGFAYYCGGFDSALIAQTLGLPEVRFSATVTGGGGGSAAAVELAATAVTSGSANVVVSVMALQQLTHRFGGGFGAQGKKDKPVSIYSPPPTPQDDFAKPYGLFGPAQMFGLIARRHMHKYGTTRDHLAEVAIATRLHASTRPTARFRDPLTREDYYAARMVADPLCLLDCCLETDGAVAVITTSTERARDLRQRPIRIAAGVHGGSGRWGQAISWQGMPDDEYTSSGQRGLAERLYRRAGLKPSDVDVALLYDHFTPMVLMQLEDYGFCPVGESGPFVADGHIRHVGGSLPVNTHGGNLSEAYIIGMTHVREAVEQLRGTAVNQVADAEVALVTGGPAALPTSSLLLTKD